METKGEFNRRLADIKHQLRRQKAIVEELGQVLPPNVQSVLRFDQAIILDELKARVMREVEDAHMTEVLASKEFSKRQCIGGIVGFTAGTIFAAIDGRENPVSRGINVLQSTINEKAPFNTVLVAIGKNGLPDDVTVVPISALARQSNRNESEIMGNFAKDGYLLLDSWQFTRLIDNLKSKVLDGSTLLPMNVEKVTSYLLAIKRKIKPPE